MAGVKITDLTPLATAASDDLLYIVDVSDTSESPQGTSKAIEVGNIIPFSRSIFAGTLNANTAIISSQINNLGGTISINYTSDWNFTIERTGGDLLNGVAVINFNNGTLENETATAVFLTYSTTYLSFADSVSLKFVDNTYPSVDGSVAYCFTIDYYYNGFDL